MSEYRRSYQKGGIYFFTLVTYQRQPIFSSRCARVLLFDSIKKVQTNHPFEQVAYCFMPDHLHFLWQMPENDSEYSMRMSVIKRDFSKHCGDIIVDAIPKTASRAKRRESTIWQRRFWEHLIRDQEDLDRHIDYIHYNPVKHGLVKRPADWACSSFMGYVREGVYDLGWGETYKIDKKKYKFGE